MKLPRTITEICGANQNTVHFGKQGCKIVTSISILIWQITGVFSVMVFPM